jgi:hypothetical protein
VAGGGNIAGAEDSFVGAGDLNQISSGGAGSFIGGGGFEYALGGNLSAGNQISGSDAFIGAGDQNVVSADDAAVVTGINNGVSGTYASIGGGQSNVLSGYRGFIGAGVSNTIAGGATDAAIAGGNTNSVTASYGAIAGGEGSRVSGTAGAVGGGETNVASGTASTVPGGYHNTAAGTASFAAGFGADANANGSFVWSDDSGSSKHLVATRANQFLVRASGGVAIYSNPALTSGVSLAAGSGAWSNLSDRTMKTDVSTLDDDAILSKVAALPVSEWSYTSERGVRHIGPMAQDFYAAFRVGEDDRHITTIDEDGVALAAVKALHAENAALRAAVAPLRDRNVRLAARVAALQTDEAELRREVRALARTVSKSAQDAGP